MDSTGSTTSKGEDGKRGNELPKDKYKYIPSIQEQGLVQKKKLRGLFDSYLKPS